MVTLWLPNVTEMLPIKMKLYPKCYFVTPFSEKILDEKKLKKKYLK
jgi:hypothetical protein